MSSWLKDIGGGLISGAASLIGGGISAITGKQSGDREYERQKEFAQHGLRWKVADAKAAGIHPIFAVGANTPTYSPQAAVGSDFGVSAAGQNISRAIEAGQTRREREEMADVQKRYYEAQISNVEAQTRQHEAQTESIKQGIINDALYNNTDFLAQSVLASSDRVRNHGGVPPKPVTNGNQGFDQPTPRYDFEFGLDGKRVAVAHSQTMHDKYEDMYLAEYWPVVLGLAADARFKLTREPVMAEDGKWYAYNGSYYAPINIRTYRHEWENSVINRARLHGKYNRYSAGSGINSRSGGGGV